MSREIPWIAIRDPEGMVHMLGECGEDHDWTHCGLIFATKQGWSGVHPDAKVDVVCAKCAEHVITAWQRRLGTTYTFSTSTPNVTITDCTFGGPVSERANTMRVSRKQLEAHYRSGYDFAMRGIPPNCGISEHPHDRYWAMAHKAGWHDGNAEFERLLYRLAASERPTQ